MTAGARVKREPAGARKRAGAEPEAAIRPRQEGASKSGSSPYVKHRECRTMQKIKLELESLTVQSFVTSAERGEHGTVIAHEPTRRGPNCGSAFDACETGLCTFDCPETYSPDACPTYYPEYCESANDACPSGRGCTEIDC